MLATWPTILYIILYLIGMISALEGQRLKIAGMTYFVYGFALLILAGITNLGITYFIVVHHATYGPMISMGGLLGSVLGILGVILLIIGVRAIVSAYKVYLSSTHQQVS